MGIWLTKEINDNRRPTQPLQRVSTANTFEHGTFIIFDPLTWQRIKRKLIILWNAIEIKL